MIIALIIALDDFAFDFHLAIYDDYPWHVSVFPLILKSSLYEK